MKRHKQDCETWKSRDAKAVRSARLKATNLARYNVEDASHAPEVAARRKATNLARYGAANPFAKEATTFQKVQDALDGKRPVLKGADNPFAKPEVKEKILASLKAKYGEDNPQRVPEIRARTRATNLDKYGGELLASPLLRAKAAVTNVARYGTTEPSRTPEVVEKIRQTNLARYNVEWTNQDPEIRRKQLETMFARYDGQHYFASDQGKQEVRAVLKEKYGVEFPGAIDGHWEKAIATFRKNHEGLIHPLQLARPDAGPNKLEAIVAAFAPSLIYTGNHTFWKWLPKLGRHKNPDFLVPGPDPEHPQRDLSKVVEVFGDFWHSRIFTGKAPFDHEQELIDAYADIGIDCIVLWESEIKTRPDEVRSRLAAHVLDGA
jgi:hypothetical protein